MKHSLFKHGVRWRHYFYPPYLCSLRYDTTLLVSSVQYGQNGRQKAVLWPNLFVGDTTPQLSSSQLA